MKHYGDITKLSGYTLPIVDVITGGGPCQDLSVAGKRAGLSGERSGLFMEQVRIVKEMRARDVQESGRAGQYVRPRYMVWENVPGAFSSNGGRDFQAVLSEIAKIAEPDAADVPMPEKGKWTNAGCIYDELGCWSIAWRVHDAQFWGVPQRRKRISLVADFGGLSAPEILFERKGLSRDSEPGTEAGKAAAGTTGSGAGSAISFQERAGKPWGGKGILIQHEHVGALSTLNNREIVPSLVASAYKGPGNTQDGKVVVQIVGIDLYNQSITGGVSKSLNSAATDSDHTPCVMECFQNTGQGWWNESDVGETIRTPCGGDSVKANLVLNSASVVRRLTPLECERLQGYPDGWTDIGEWTDSKGKKHKDADSPRYKALGNSIALPFWQWMARRICAMYKRNITMASLFDGIGGFPLVFERCGAKAVWASEIEEFPIAVTKKHFPEEDAC